MIKLLDLLLEVDGQKKAIVMAGGAGAGKSYFVRQIRPELNKADWVELNFKIKQLEADRKKIETMMIESYKYGGLSDSEGMKIIPAAISREGSITLQVTIPKE